jgi:hypothetical protein
MEREARPSIRATFRSYSPGTRSKLVCGFLVDDTIWAPSSVSFLASGSRARFDAAMLSAGPAAATFTGPVAVALAGVGVHSIAMILTTVVIAIIVHEWLGVSVPRYA